MDRMQGMEAFVCVAEAGSFSAAARRMGVTRSVVTHRIQQFEGLIDTALFHRNTRSVRLTDTGEAYYPQCAEMIRSFGALTDRMRSARSLPAGKLRILLPSVLAVDLAGIWLARFRDRHPDIQLEVLVRDGPVDLIREGIDLAFRFTLSRQDGLIERKLFAVERIFCASAGYLAHRGAIRQPQDLLEHSLGIYNGHAPGQRFVFERDGQRQVLSLPAELQSSSVHLLRDYALAGGGIICVPELVVREALRSGRLLRVLPGHATEQLELRALYPVTSRGCPRIHALLDFLGRLLVSEAAGAGGPVVRLATG